VIQILLQLDHQLFTVINHLPHNILFDSFFSFISGVGTFGIVWVVIVSVLILLEEINDKKGLLALILSIIFIFIFVELGLKNWIGRERPQFKMPSTQVVEDLRITYSFPSVHTAIAFAGALILAVHHKKWRWWYFLLAILIGFSRIYLGKHYPSDVVTGAVLGILIGSISLRIANLLAYFDKRRKHSET